MNKNIIEKMKSKISLNIFAIFGFVHWIYLCYLKFYIDAECYNLGGCYDVFVILGGIYFVATLIIYCTIFILFIIDLLIHKNINNEFILKNKTYNIFWIIGMILSMIFLSGSAILIVKSL